MQRPRWAAPTGKAIVVGLTLAIWALGSGCTDGPTGTPKDDASDADPVDGDVSKPELEPGQICYQGEVKACIVEGGKAAMICNASGTAFVQGDCKGPDGREALCKDGACTTCFPGTKKCLDEETVAQCSADGSAWEPLIQCQGGTSGQVCTERLGPAVCETLCAINVKFNSYIGCDYWAVDLDNAFVPGGNETGYYDAAGAQYAIVIAVPPDSPLPSFVDIYQMEGGEQQKVVWDSNGDPLPTTPLQPGELRVFKMPKRDVNGTTQAPLAYRVVASAPIIAYQFNPLENANVFSNDASLLLPATLLGRDYIVMTREQTFDTLRGFITVVGTDPQPTEVFVDFTADTLTGTIYPGTARQAPIPPYKPGGSAKFVLEQFDVLNIETNRPGADLTGTIIRANRRVAVFGGSEASNAPNTAACVDIDPVTSKGVCAWDRKTSCKSVSDCVSAGFNTCCADHLEQQMFPVSTWGKTYVATKSWDRNMESDVWRIMAAEDNTKVFVVPPQPGISVPVLNRGEWYEFESRQHFEVHADKPILVGQFLAAQDAPEPNVGGIPQAGDAGTGDPAFMLAIPIEQYRFDFVVLTPAEYEFNYINVVAPTGSVVEVNGEEIPAGYFEVIGSGDYSVYRQQVPPGAHTITSSEPAGVIVYGYDQYVSYGYTGGLDLVEINKTF